MVRDRTVALEEFHQRELEFLRVTAEAGSELAPAAALFYCRQHDVAVPLWLVGAAAIGFCALLNPRTSKKRGRSANPRQRHHQNMVDLVRWEQVKASRHVQVTSQNEKSYLLEAETDLPKKFRTRILKMADWAGRDCWRAYECASMMLQGTPAFGGPDAMKASYRRVEKNFNHPSETWRYHTFHPDFLESIGMKHISQWEDTSKIVPQYTLTLS
jgi:hypothetical protein